MSILDWFKRKSKAKAPPQSEAALLAIGELLSSEDARARLSLDPSPYALRVQAPPRALPVLLAFRAWGLGDLRGLAAVSSFEASWAEEELAAARALSHE